MEIRSQEQSTLGKVLEERRDVFKKATLVQRQGHVPSGNKFAVRIRSEFSTVMARGEQKSFPMQNNTAGNPDWPKPGRALGKRLKTLC